MSRANTRRAAVPAALEDARARFLVALRVRGQSPATIESRAESLGVFFAFLATQGVAVADVRAVTRAHAHAFAAWLAQRGWSIATQHARLTALRRFFAHLVAIDAVLVDPCADLVLPPQPDRLPRHVLTRTQVARVLDAPDTATKTGLRDRAIIETFYSTGLRLAELARLGVHDVDVRTGFVRVHGGKGAKDRVAPLGKKAADAIAEYLRVARAEWARAQRDERALWLGSLAPHRALTSQAIAVMLKNVLRACGIAHGRAHVWRHTCATHLVAAGANVAYVQRLLGHRSLETTQRYTRVAVPEVKATHRRAHPRSQAKASAAFTAGERNLFSPAVETETRT